MTLLEPRSSTEWTVFVMKAMTALYFLWAISYGLVLATNGGAT